jgi:polyisoprenoid-binding protein YceI
MINLVFSLGESGMIKKVMCIFSICIVCIWGNTYKLDTAHSSINFYVKYLMLTKVSGGFTNYTGQMDVQNGHIVNLTGKIHADSIDTRNSKRDKHLKSDDFFNVKVYPSITFTSQQIATQNNNDVIIIGKLNIHGITNNVSIPFTVTEPIIDSYGKERIGVFGAVRINRKNYGINFAKKMDNGGMIVDDFVDIDLSFQFIKQEE